MTPADRRQIQHRGETATTATLEQLGYQITDLNELVGNCPFADLLATKAGDRVLVQVKTTTIPAGTFTTPPAKARALHRMAEAIGCRTSYAFVHLLPAGISPVVRFASAVRVAELADADELAYHGTNRYHVNINLFDDGAPLPEITNPGDLPFQQLPAKTAEKVALP